MATSSSEVMGSEWWTGLVGTAHGPLLPHHSRFLASGVLVRLMGSNTKGTSDHIPSGFPPPFLLPIVTFNIAFGPQELVLPVRWTSCLHSLWCITFSGLFPCQLFPSLLALWAPSLSVPALLVWQVCCWMTKLQWCKSIQTVIWNVCIDYVTAKSLHVHTSYFACTTKSSPNLPCADMCSSWLKVLDKRGLACKSESLMHTVWTSVMSCPIAHLCK